MSQPKYTLEDYENLKSAYSSGVLSASYAGQSMVYRSMSEMKELMQDMEAELNIKKPRGVLQRHVQGVYSKGL